MKITDQEWREVFRLRCKSRRGDGLSDTEQDLCDRAYKEDRKRYAAMNDDVFDATVPFGSNARAPRNSPHRR